VRAMFEQPLPRWLGWAADPEQMRRAPFLAGSPLFTGLPRRLLARLATRFFEKMYRPGEIVFEEGDPGRALFVVVEGAVEITRATPQGPYILNTLGPGDAFGELALIDDFRAHRHAGAAAHPLQERLRRAHRGQRPHRGGGDAQPLPAARHLRAA
jgi:signal-transduction protein with cAMP-binding, CBS, and nucleotidyltransferase domain